MAYTFPLDPDEKIILEIRRHQIASLPVVISGSLLILVAIGLSYASGRYTELALIRPYLPLMTVILLGLAALVILGGHYIQQQSRLILTSKHLVKVDQNGLFSQNVAQLSLDELEDVTAMRSGVVATLLDYGKVTFETAGSEKHFSFDPVAHPQKVTDQLLQTKDTFKGNREDND